MNYDAGDGSHLPLLIEVMALTDGPVLELGMGLYSSPFLHWACYNKRKLVSYDEQIEYYNMFKYLERDYHKVNLVKDWDSIDLSGHWSVALIDHSPGERRNTEIRKLVNTTDYLVLHDTQERSDKKYKYSEIYGLFKYRKDDRREKPFTTILSNCLNPPQSIAQPH